MRPEESGLMMDNWWKENRSMRSDDKEYSYYIDLTLTRNTGLRSRFPRDADTTARLERIRSIEPYEASPRRSNSLAIAITCLLALVFGIALWIGSGLR